MTKYYLFSLQVSKIFANVYLIMNILPGDYSIGVIPVPIPNTEVKPYSADGTVGASPWESKSLPGFFY